MSRKLIKNLAKTNTVQQESSSEEEDYTSLGNKFADLDFEILSSPEGSDQETHSQEEIKEPEPVSEPVPKTAIKETPQEKPVSSEEDFDAILEDFKTSHIEETKEVQAKESCLKRNSKHFDAEAEIRKLFKEGRGQTKKQHKYSKRTILTPNKENWPKNIDYVISMDKKLESNHEIYYFIPTKAYFKLHERYLVCVESNDPNALASFLQAYPFHIEALYQLVLVYQLQGRYDTMSGLLEKLLFAFQLSFHHQFSPIGAFTYMDMHENRYNEIFFKSLFMYVDCLGRRGCMRTALEFVKFILAMDVKDPMGCLFLVDFYAIRSKSYTWFMKFVNEFCEEMYGTGSLFTMPHIVYSYALARVFQEEKKDVEIEERHISRIQQLLENDKNFRFESLMNEEPSVILLAAVLCYPAIAHKLYKKISPSSTFLEHADSSSQYGDTFKSASIYAERSSDLWKADYIARWLRNAITSYEALMNLHSALSVSYIPSFSIDRYDSLEPAAFSDAVRNLIPEDLAFGQRPQARRGPAGNLDPNSNPLYLFFATMLPWNFVNFRDD